MEPMPYGCIGSDVYVLLSGGVDGAESLFWKVKSVGYRSDSFIGGVLISCQSTFDGGLCLSLVTGPNRKKGEAGPLGPAPASRRITLSRGAGRLWSLETCVSGASSSRESRGRPTAAEKRAQRESLRASKISCQHERPPIAAMRP